MDAIFLRAESDHELDDEVFLGLSKCEFRAASFSYRSEISVPVQSEDLILQANRGEDKQKHHLPLFQCTLDVPADTTASTMPHPYSWKKSSRFSGFTWSPCVVLSVSHLPLLWARPVKWKQIIQASDVTRAGVSWWTQRDLGWSVHERARPSHPSDSASSSSLPE